MACNPACKKLRGLSSKMLNRVKTQQVFVHMPEITITGKNSAREIEDRQLQSTKLSRTEMSKKNLSMNFDLGIAEGAVRSSLEVENQENFFLMRVSYLSGTNLQEPHIPHRMSE